MEAWKDVIHDNELETRRAFNRTLTAGGEISFDTVIAGGGVAGLFCAWTLKQTFPSQSVCVLDRRTHIGGRIRLSKLADGTILENGPWRVHESHKHVIRLIKDLGLTLEANASSHDEPTEDSGENDLDGLSTFDNDTYRMGAETARVNDVMSGYEGINDADSKANVYHGQRHKSGTYYYIKEGFMEIITRLEKKCHELGVDIRSNHMVIDVTRIRDHYKVDILENKTHDNKSLPTIVFGSRFVTAIPPHLVDWKGCIVHLRPLLDSVKSLSLHHIYAQEKNSATITGIHRTPGALSQVIGGDTKARYFQISYSAGRIADYWQRLHLNHPEKFEKKIKAEFHSLYPKIELSGDIHAFYWRHAVHMWKPIFGQVNTLAHIVDAAIEPHPVQLPQFYFIGEACSGNQGWIEGALETTLEAVSRMQSPKAIQYGPPSHNDYLIYDGRYIDMRKFKYVHPGSQALIEEHLNNETRDVTDLFNIITHPDYAYAMLMSLQTGWKRE